MPLASTARPRDRATTAASPQPGGELLVLSQLLVLSPRLFRAAAGKVIFTSLSFPQQHRVKVINFRKGLKLWSRCSTSCRWMILSWLT